MPGGREPAAVPRQRRLDPIEVNSAVSGWMQARLPAYVYALAASIDVLGDEPMDDGSHPSCLADHPGGGCPGSRGF